MFRLFFHKLKLNWHKYWKQVLGGGTLLILFYSVLRFLVAGFSACDVANALTILNEKEYLQRQSRGLLSNTRASQQAPQHYYDQIGPNTPSMAQLHGHSPLFHPPCLEKWLASRPRHKLVEDFLPLQELVNNVANSSSASMKKRRYEDEIADYVQSKYRALGFDVIQPIDHHQQQSSQSRSYELSTAPSSQRPWMECNRDKLTTSAISFSAVADSNHPIPFHHYAAFSKHYFRFYSLLVWQSRVYHIINHEACVHTFVIDEDQDKFWKDISAVSPYSTMNRKIVEYMNFLTHYKTLSTNKCESVVSGSGYQREMFNIMMDSDESYFLHPADALLLTSMILNDDTCTFAGAASSQSSSILSNVNVTLLLNGDYSSDHGLSDSRENEGPMSATEHQRSPNQIDLVYVDYSSFANVRAVFQHLHELAHSSHRSSSSTDRKHGIASNDMPAHINIFPKMVILQEENLLLYDLVRTMFTTDIVIAISLESLQYVTYMKPCSVVIAVQTPLRDVVDELNQSYEHFPSKNRHAIKHDHGLNEFIFNDQWLRGMTNSIDAIYHVLSIDDLDAAMLDNEFIQHHPHCKQFLPFKNQANRKVGSALRLPSLCSRGIKGWDLNRDRLHEVVKKSVLLREECIKSHPYYS